MKRTILLLQLLLIPFFLKAQRVEIDGINYNLNTEAKTAEVTSGNYSGIIVIPSTVNYLGIVYDVTCIGESAFFYSDITSITIPEGVTSIGDNAFCGSSRLSSVVIPESVTVIGWGAFELTKWLNNHKNGLVYAGKVVYRYKGDMPKNTSIVLDEGTKGVAGDAFRGYYYLTSIIIPESVTSIGKCAFYGCSGLTSITIPDNLAITTIGRGTFYECYSLKSITIPKNVKNIEENAFMGCSNLTSIIIPDSVTSIGDYAFSGCRSLSSVTIPDVVTIIGTSAFDGCKLETVIAKNPLTKCGESFSDRTFQHAMLYIPEGTWREAIYDGDWYQFNNIREITVDKQSLAPSRAYTMMNVQTSEYAVYNQAGNEVEIAHAFYSIDEEDPNSSWQIIDDSQGLSIMNIGSKKYLSVAAGGALSLSSNRVALDVIDTENGMTINGGSQEWVFVTNNSVTAIDNLTNVELPVANDTDDSTKSHYSIDGKTLSQPQRGLNILQNKNGRAKKILVK